MSKRTVTAARNAALTKYPTPQRGSRPSDNTEFVQLLDLLGIKDDERISICSLTVAKKFHHTTPTDRDNAVRLASSAPYEGRDVWFSVNPVRLPDDFYGRGGDEHVTRCVALYADIDVKAGGVTDSEVAEKVALDISTALGVQPVAVVASGHGGHAYWLLDPDDDGWTLDTPAKRAAAQAAYRRFHRLCAEVADRHGCGIDNVAQPSRILRVPGTFNHKDPANPVEVSLTAHPYGPPSAPLTYEQVYAALDAHGIPERPEDREVLGDVVSDSGEWEFGEATHSYVSKMVTGWATDVPRPGVGRHNWLIAQATRLACAYRLGLITEADHRMAVNTLESAFLRILAENGESRTPMPANEFDAALGWGEERASRMSDEDAADDLGVDLDGDGRPTMGERKATAAVNLPDEFWNSHPVLQHIRQKAHATVNSADAVLGAVLAWVAAHMDPAVKVDTGVKTPMQTNMFVGLVGDSGLGKTSASDCARDLLNIEFGDPFAHSVGGTEIPEVEGVGSGQGLADAFMGWEIDVNAEKPTKERRQVRHKLMMLSDEGASMVKGILDDKKGSDIGPSLRSAWSGAMLGQANASADRKRKVEAGSYSFGLCVNFQLEAVAEMTTPEQLGYGTPQRFVFFPLIDPSIPRGDMLPADPGTLTLKMPAQAMHYCDELKVELQLLRADIQRGDVVIANPMESHRTGMAGHLAGLLVVLCDPGRTTIYRDDIRRAEMIIDNSIKVHGAAMDHQRERKAAEQDRQVQARISERVATAAAVDDKDLILQGLVIRIRKYVTEAGGKAKWKGAEGLRQQKFKGPERALADIAVQRMVDAGELASEGGWVNFA